jgi:hypothetical protein
MEFTHPKGRRLLEEVGKIFAGDGTIFEKKDKHIIFVCGGPVRAGSNSLRSRFLNWAKTELPDIVPVLAEDAYGESYSDELPKFVNLGHFERLIAGVSDCVLIFPESVGSYAEIGLFSATSIKTKILVANQDIHHDGDSFLNLGPISQINSSSFLRPAIAVSTDHAERGFDAVKERLARLKRRSNRRKFCYGTYPQLSMEDKLVAVLATIILLRAVTLPGLTQSVKTTFGTVNKPELQHLLSVLVAGQYVLRSGEYVLPNPVVRPFLEFEKIYLEEVIGSATLFYQRHYPKTLECLRTIQK